MLGLALAAAGLVAALAGAALYMAAGGSRVLAVRVGTGGLIAGLVGSMLLLLGADRLPPEERDR